MANKTPAEPKPLQENPRTDRRTEIPDAPILRQSVTVRCEPQAAYDLWRDFSNLPKFMTDLVRVETQGDKSKWTIDLPRGPKVQWDAQIIQDRPGELISWRSLEGSQVEQAGTVMFTRAPAGRGTVIGLSLSYSIPGGKLTELATKLMLEDPKTLVLLNLRRFKAYMETGQIPTIEGQSSGREQDYPNMETH